MADPEGAASLTLSLDALVRSVGINRGTPHGFFLGAGASIRSGMPSATTCIWQWKRELFLTSNPGLEHQFREISLPSVQRRIQQWLDDEEYYPPLGAPEEYGFYVERCYPIAQDRRQYFQSLTAQAQPYIGYQLLALLAEAGIVTSVWTPNFDGLAARAAAAAKIAPIEVGLDTAARVVRQPRSGELLCVALHGDYRYDALKNMPEELQRQDRQLREALIQTLRSTTLIVSGYSGRDASVMEALTAAYSQPGAGRLYWCGHESPEPSPAVRELLLTAWRHGREAYYVPTLGFDDLLVRLALHCLTDPFLMRAQQVYAQFLNNAEANSPPFSVEGDWTSGLIKSNAFAIECPGEVLQFDASGFDQPGAWKLLRSLTEGTEVEAGLQRGKVLALGTIDGVKAAFGERIIGEIERSPITGKDLAISDGVVVSLLTKALVRAIAGTHELATDGQDLVWELEPSSTTCVANTPCQVHDAAILSLRRYGGRQYLVIKPTLKVTLPSGGDVSPEVEQELKRERLTKQYNQQFNAALEQWRRRLLGGGTRSFEFPAGCGSTFRFTIKSAPAFAKIAASQRGQAITVPPTVQRHIVHTGVQYEEPKLLFSNQQGDGFVADAYPVRGIVANQPYDFALTRRGLGREISVGVLCPKQDAGTVAAYLDRLHRRALADSKRDYLLDYPGFASAFGLPIQLPHPGDGTWAHCPEPDPGLGTREGAIELGHQITSAIESLNAAAAPNLILIYIPERWRTWDHYADEGECYDPHDFVKAYCVQRGIPTQFLREATLAKEHTCEVLWWLALSFYVKAMRTPWVLDSLDADTAFIGLGFSLDAKIMQREHVILGCSHIYSSEGLGLRYKLSKIENPIIRQRNPFMSREDARRMGDNVRQLFFESMMRLPKRVVIHKRTAFLKEEREGLLEGLAGIDAVDMLEINTDPMLRYVASNVSRGGTFQGDGFPVKRGTAVVLDNRRALLWVHGTTQAIVPNRRYYLGSSRIPAPLVVIRHHGASNLSVLAREVLGLSKMSWNTFDMYTKLPATIQSSNAIAKIGALLERFGPLSYDYRLFI